MYYPKPKLERRMDDGYFLSLNGEWQYELFDKRTSDNDILNYNFTKFIMVPYCLESKLSGVNLINFDKLIAYHKTFSFQKKLAKVILNFGAVDQKCWVYLNNIYLGEHLGGYLPFSFDITDIIDNEKENKLIVIVLDELNKNYPYGKQSRKNKGIWYTQISGIWKDVYLESIPECGIEKIKIKTDIDKKELFIEFNDNVDTLKTINLYYKGELIKKIDTYDNKISIIFDSIHLWSPEEPNLYDIVIENQGEIIKSYTNFYKIELKDFNGHEVFYLNNEPYYLHGLLDQGYYEDGLYTPNNIEMVENDLKKIKELGFNTLRKHIKIEEEYWYYLCDKLGILVWQDMVNAFPYSFFFESVLPLIGLRKFNPKLRLYKKDAQNFFINHCIKTIELLDNYNCIMLWTIFNEGWGQFKVNKVYKQLSQVDQRRFFDVCSGWFSNKNNHFDSRHIYFKKIKIKKINKPCLILSEFGGYSLAVDEKDRKEFGYKSFKNRTEFNKAFYNLYFEEIIPNLKKGLAASIYTQVSDVENEINGIFSYDRKIVKLDPEVANKIKEELKFQK